MYNLNDIFSMVRYQLDYILQCLPYIILHFMALFFLRNILLKVFALNGGGGSSLLPANNYFQYRFFLLGAMLVFSWLVTVFVFIYQNFGFYFCGDFIFIAGVLLGWRAAWPVLLAHLIFMPAWLHLIGYGGVLISYAMLDSIIYFAVGLLSGAQFDAVEEEYGYSDILLVCANKLVAALVSTACWALLINDSRFSGINILIFRLLGWPLASLPMIFLVLFLMKQDAKQLDLHPARKAENPA